MNGAKAVANVAPKHTFITAQHLKQHFHHFMRIPWGDP